MPALNFKQQFRAKIESGFKRHTIRAERAIPIERGDALHLYTGMRTKACELIFRTRCTRVQAIEIDASTSAMVRIDGVLLDASEREELAQHDGFDNWDQMLAFWEGRLPFKGQMIHWKFPPDVPA
jgi:hypothetical protein